MNLTRETLVPESEAHWLSMRKQDCTSTEIAALFGCSPYLTEYELHHRKAGAISTDDFAANERMRWGTRLESAIAYGVAEDLGLVVEPFKTYVRIPEIRLGASFDFKIVGIVDGFSGNEAARDMFRQHGPGIMEIKNIDSLQFKRAWLEDGDEIEAPPHIEFQVQAQQEVADLNWSIIAPLVGGNTPKPIIRLRDTEVGRMIREKASQFWARVDAGTPPPADFNRDHGTIASLFANSNGELVDMSDNNRLAVLCAERAEAARIEKEAGARKEAATAEILLLIGEAGKVLCADGYTISAPTIAGGFVSYERKPYRRITVSNKAKKAA
jgi:putative phage-type endonuclease